MARQNTLLGRSNHARGTVRLNDRALIPEGSFLYKKEEEEEKEKEKGEKSQYAKV